MNPQFSRTLLGWYDRHKRDLPWRRTKDPYFIWVSEIMLQQTTVAAVIPYYQRWIKQYPTIADLAKAPLQQVLKSWQGLGYYNRVKNLHKASQIVLERFQGHLPRDPELIRSLPGFGPYTTGSVLSIAFGLPLTIIDANVRRVVMRLLAIQAPAQSSQDVDIDNFLKKVLPSRRVGDFNQALMELGALVCRHKEPLCNICPIRSGCKAYDKGLSEIIPTPRKKAIKDIHAVVAVIENKGRYLIQKRPSKGLLADLWEFPGGKMEAGESRNDALARELKEELGVQVRSARRLFDIKHYYTQFRVHLSVYQVQLDKIPPSTIFRKWVAVKDFFRYPMPSGSSKIVDRLIA